MSRGINKVILVGNLGNDPEMKFAPRGDAICNLSVATSESWKDKQSGEAQERTEWHRVVVFKRLAEICGEYLRKGSKVYIEGQLRTRKWQDKETGADRYSTEIVAREMQMLDSRAGLPGGDQGQSQAYQRPQPSQQQPHPGGAQQPPHYSRQPRQPQQPQQQQQQMVPAEAPFDDDIPF